jgi:uncharacterized protein
MSRNHLFSFLSVAVIAAGCVVPRPVRHATLDFLGHKVDAELAVDREMQEQGLMGRTQLRPGLGMLFVFDSPRRVCMWMRNTLVPLSVAFLSSDGVVVNIENMAPETDTEHCSVRPVSFALEVSLGWFSAHGIRADASVSGLPNVANRFEVGYASWILDRRYLDCHRNRPFIGSCPLRSGHHRVLLIFQIFAGAKILVVHTAWRNSMNMEFIILGVAVLLAILSGCSSKPSGGPYGDKGVDWYKAHGGERTEQIRWCNDQAATVQMNSAGCSQAVTAANMSAAKGGLPAGYWGSVRPAGVFAGAKILLGVIAGRCLSLVFSTTASDSAPIVALPATA